MPEFRVGKPRCGLVRSTNQAMTGNVWNKISWSSARYQDPVVWSASTPTNYVIPKTGLWLALFQLDDVTNAENLYARIAVNGAGYVIASSDVVKNQRVIQVTLLDELVAGDVITAEGFRTSAGAWTASANYTRLDLTRIGPDRWTG